MNQISTIPVFKRHELAKNLSKNLLHAPAAASGLFITAPRRTGKSTFIRNDLMPALKQDGAAVIYVDLWEDKDKEPGQQILNAIIETLSKNGQVKASLYESFSNIKINAGLVKADVNLKKEKDIQTLAQAFEHYSLELDKPIVLIIDEAQHALTTEEGQNILFSLKAARDRVNIQANGLRILFTGSNQEKLSSLRNTKDQAFYMAPVVKEFPFLGEEFIKWFCENEAKESGLELNPDEVFQLFKRSGYKPEVIRAALNDIVFDLDLSKKVDNDAFIKSLLTQIQTSEKEIIEQILSLPPLQTVVLATLATSDPYSPFAKDTFNHYEEMMKAFFPHNDQAIDVPSIQQALKALKKKQFIWQSKRGSYALEDIGIKDLVTTYFDVGANRKNKERPG